MIHVDSPVQCALGHLYVYMYFKRNNTSRFWMSQLFTDNELSVIYVPCLEASIKDKQQEIKEKIKRINFIILFI